MFVLQDIEKGRWNISSFTNLIVFFANSWELENYDFNK